MNNNTTNKLAIFSIIMVPVVELLRIINDERKRKHEVYQEKSKREHEALQKELDRQNAFNIAELNKRIQNENKI